jgi:hypothetical protein
VSFAEVDGHINDCITACRATIAAAGEAAAALDKAMESYREAGIQAEISGIHAGAAAQLYQDARDLQELSEKFIRKARLFEDGGLN